MSTLVGNHSHFPDKVEMQGRVGLKGQWLIIGLLMALADAQQAAVEDQRGSGQG